MNPHQRIGFALALAITLLLGVAAGFWLARGHGATSGGANTLPAGSAAGEQDRPVLYWYDPMKPEQHFDQPGKSPYMDMALQPKYAQQGTAVPGLAIDPQTRQSLGIRIATAQLGQLQTQVTATGIVQWNERQVAIVQARAAGFVARVYQRAAGDVVRRGTPLVDLLVPDWVAAQQEFLVLRQHADAELLAAARQRLRLLGMPDELIEQLEATGKSDTLVTVRAPIAGVIQSLGAQPGMRVTDGFTLAEIKGTDPVWVEAAVPESLAGLVEAGAASQVTLTAYPANTFTGTVAAVLPATNIDTRTLRVRIELPNHDSRLKEGMFAQVAIAPRRSPQAVLVPSEAVVRTGARKVVILALAGGRFQPAEVQTGRDAGGKVEVLQGLAQGQQIVVSGQFLIDSEASLQGALARLGAPSAGQAQHSNADEAGDVASQLHEADGTVESITSHEIVISHSPVKSLGMGMMTMPFQLADPEMSESVQVGDRVHFQFHRMNGEYYVERLEKTGSAP